MTKETIPINVYLLEDLLDYLEADLGSNEWRRGASEKNDLYLLSIERDINEVKDILSRHKKRHA